MGDCSRSEASFPLTPGLSLGERENPRLLAGESEAARTFKSCGWWLALPKGEGWGEGEGNSRARHTLRTRSDITL